MKLLFFVLFWIPLLSAQIKFENLDFDFSSQSQYSFVGSKGKENNTKEWDLVKACYKIFEARKDLKESINLGVIKKDSFVFVFYLGDSYESKISFFNSEKEIHLYSNSEVELKWLFLQLVSIIQLKDTRLHFDIPVSRIISMEKSDFLPAFQYREPNFRANYMIQAREALNTSSLDLSWGIWGHNIKKELEKGNYIFDYSEFEGNINKNQICFTSPRTIESLSRYIADNYGYGNPKKVMNFMIMPLDNNHVCSDKRCLEIGNNKFDASPSIWYVLKELAKKFPNHRFFTTWYKTVCSMPEEKLPDNIGVFINTLSLPKRKLTFEEWRNSKLYNIVSSLKDKVSTVYLWDYGANFDNYLAPYPMLLRFQNHLQYFNESGVDGVFLNASGYDYSIFDDIKCYVSSVLMIDPYANVQVLIKDFLEINYPISKELIFRYYWNLENKSFAEKYDMSIYEGISEIQKKYLDFNELSVFYDELYALRSQLKKSELRKVNDILESLDYVILSEFFNSGKCFEIEDGRYILRRDFKECIRRLKETTKIYREENGEIGSFISEILEIADRKDLFINELKGKPLKILNADNKSFEISQLTNGQFGLPSNYHLNWLVLNDKALSLSFPDDLSGDFCLKIRFLKQSKWNIYMPSVVSLTLNEKKIDFFASDSKNTIEYQWRISLKNKDKLELKIISENKSFALDEIYLFKNNNK